MELRTRMLVDSAKVTALCIKKDYYTCGTVDEYGEMLASCENADSNDAVLKIALDIFHHSNHEHMDGSRTEEVENICFEILNDCTYFLASIDE